MIAALALTMFTGAAFAQKATPKPLATAEAKQENKSEKTKYHAKKKENKEKKHAEAVKVSATK